MISQDHNVKPHLSIFLALVVAGLSVSLCSDAALALPTANGLQGAKAPLKTTDKAPLKSTLKSPVKALLKSDPASLKTLEAKIVSEPSNAEAHFLFGPSLFEGQR